MADQPGFFKKHNYGLNMFSAKSKLFDEEVWGKMAKHDSDARIWNDKNPGKPQKKMKINTWTYAKKSAMSIVGGSGAKRENALNALGFLTRHQKNIAKAGGIAGINSFAIPAAGAVGGAMTIMEGGGIVDYAADYMIPGAMAFVGWGMGKNLGLLGGKMAGMPIAMARKGARMATGGRFKGSSAMTRHRWLLGAGGVTGVASGLAFAAAGLAIGEGMKTMGDSNNLINQVAGGMKFATFHTDVEDTQGTLTHRQRTLSKIAKSGLNDRGQLLGNEAMIMAGII